LLNNKDVKKRFLEEFPTPKLKLEGKILAPPYTNHYSLVGTAFDYLMRFYLKKLNPNAVTQKWVAEAAVSIAEKAFNIVQGVTLTDKVNSIIAEAKNNYKDYLKTGKMDEALMRSAVKLAQVDAIYRAKYVDENMGLVEDKDIEDLKKLISLVDPKLFKAKSVCMLNPTFGEASCLVGGADADLIIDNRLVDIKTTKELKLERKDLNQIIGYYILYKINGIDNAPTTIDIDRIGIYSSRYGQLFTLPIKEIIDEKNLPKFIKWFKERASQESSGISEDCMRTRGTGKKKE